MSRDFAPDPNTPSVFARVSWPAVLTLAGLAGAVLVPLLAALALAA